MAITVQPVDGLIHRLLQQNGRPSPSANTSSATAARQDRVSISVHARNEMVQPQTPKQQPGDAGSQNHLQTGAQGGPAANASSASSPRERALESHLLDLYRSHDGYGG